MASLRIYPDSPAGEFLVSQGVTPEVLEAARFRVLNWQFGGALTVVWPTRTATIFMKGKYLKPDADGDLPVDRSLGLIRHELHHVHQGRDWGFSGYWARHLWARVRHLSLLARDSSVEAPAYGLQHEAYAALDALASDADDGG